jgi:hypothetical protein
MAGEGIMAGGERDPDDQALLLMNQELLMKAMDRCALARDDSRIEVLARWLGKVTFLLARPALFLTPSARREFSEGLNHLRQMSS